MGRSGSGCRASRPRPASRDPSRAVPAMNGRPEASPESLPLVEAVRAAASRHRLFGPGSSLLVAVSGGPDSVALLHALTCLRADLGLTLAAGHVHHGLREEADRDAAFVRGLAG